MATRFWLPADEAAAVSPAFDGGWSDIDGAVRRRLSHEKGESPLAAGTQIAFTSRPALDRQYVSDPLTADQDISGTVAMQLLAGDTGSGTNHEALGIRVVSGDGSTERGVLLAIANYGNQTDLVNSGFRNQTYANGDALTPVTAQEGDRIVVEIGYRFATVGSPSACTAKYGEEADDLPVDETQTSDGAGWIEFSLDLFLEPFELRFDFSELPPGGRPPTGTSAV